MSALHGMNKVDGLSDEFFNFASALYEQCAKSTSDNVIISPFSVSSALTLLSQAANGKAYNNLKSGLFLNDDKTITASEYFKHNQLLKSNVCESTLSVANQIFVQQGYSLNKNLKDVAVKKFSSGVESIDFSDKDESARIMNNFVEKKTNGKIREIIRPDSISSDDRIVLINAIYFKSHWLHKFDEALTNEEDFFISDTESVPVYFMYTKNCFNWLDMPELEARALEMKYANSNLSFVIVLPNFRNGLAEVESKLKDYDLIKNLNSFRNSDEIDVKIPKFKIKYETELKDALMNLNMGGIFDDQADLSGLLSEKQQLHVSKFIHKAFIEVNEDGSEAYAASVVRVTYDSATPTIPSFRADHPFVYYILDKESRTVLFSGRITKFQLSSIEY